MDNSNTYSAIEFDALGQMLRSASGFATAEYAALCYAGSTHGTLVAAGDIPDILSRKHYIDLTDPDNPTPTERPASPVSRTDLTLLDVPTGSTLYINGVSYPAEGTVELDFPIGGVFQLRVECFPFLEFSDTIVV